MYIYIILYIHIKYCIYGIWAIWGLFSGRSHVARWWIASRPGPQRRTRWQIPRHGELGMVGVGRFFFLRPTWLEDVGVFFLPVFDF